MDLKELGLNVNQLNAVKTINGPVLLVAGAGTGKTKVLTSRIAYIINETGCPDHKILAITFTNLASREMLSRVNGILNRNVKSVISTYHSLCVRILRQDINKLPQGNNAFRVIDDEDSDLIIKQIYKDRNLKVDFAKRVKPRLMKEIINQIQILTCANDNLIWSKNYDQPSEVDELYKKRRVSTQDLNTIKSIYVEYQTMKQKNNWLDFNDLIIITHKLLFSNELVAKKWQKMFDYILVDEFQDTDELQFDILTKLVNPENNNIFAVGDPDQTIYEWRGAYSGVFKDFENTFSNTQVLILDKNYRSTQNILDVANALISHNSNRYEKNLYTDNENDDIVGLYQGDTQHEEGKFIAKKIKELIDTKKFTYRDIAILYRANYLSRFVESAILQEGLPYYVYGGVKFYQRKEVKDMICYLNLLVNPNDELSIRRIINVPNRKIGDTTIDKINLYAKQNNIDFANATKINRASDPNITWNDIPISEFYKTIDNIKKETANKQIDEYIDVIMKHTQYAEYLATFEIASEANDRLENINELKRSIKEFIVHHPEAELKDFLQEIALYTDTNNDDLKTKKENAISLMTVHFAKGTEYPIVFLVGLYEGVFPHNDFSSFEIMDEERRIAFVGITRAKKKLFLTTNTQSSRGTNSFISEIGRNNLKVTNSEYIAISNADLSWYDSKKEYDYSKNYRDDYIEFQIGDNVIHTIFGMGIVTDVNKDELTIAFKAPYGVKTISANHTSIKRIKN